MRSQHGITLGDSRRDLTKKSSHLSETINKVLQLLVLGETHGKMLRTEKTNKCSKRSPKLKVIGREDPI